jgi:hypothetical protein
MSVSIGPITIDPVIDRSDRKELDDMCAEFLADSRLLPLGSSARSLLMVLVGCMRAEMRNED